VKFSIITFGCRVNQSDSLEFEEQLHASGGIEVPPDAADLVIVNTCSVTASADQGARQTIRRIARVNPDARIVVTGCYATRDAQAVSELPNVAHVVSNNDKPRVLTVVRNAHACNDSTDRQDLTTALRFGDGEGSCGAAIEPGVAGRTAYTLRVQTGCSEPCSYCIIPKTRGRPRSVPLSHVIDEMRRVAALGFKEVALTGVHLGSYGRDLDPPSTLVSLLTALRDEFDATAPSGAPRLLVRISSLEPMDCTPEVVEIVGRAACFAPHFHLPMQHASPTVLGAMRRPYRLDQFQSLIENIRRQMPDASIGTDVIVGFPGESDDDFEMLAGYLERSPLTHVHVFPYSDRPGTEASSMNDRPPGVVVKARGLRVRQLSAALTRKFHESQLNSVHRALTLEDGTLAVTGNYLKVRIPEGQARNEWVRLEVTATRPLEGRLI
jgi:threonylcarbamoyladenosine tRNA methylthiotransferase MtaB